VINFRFHLVSLIAVFLALAVGVVMGYGVLGQPTVDTLQGRVDTVEARAERIRGENARLRREQDRLEEVLQEIDDFAVTRRLNGTTAVVLAIRGVDEERVTETVRLARRAGAIVPGIVWLEEKWGIAKDQEVAELAELLGTVSDSRTIVRYAAARALVGRILSGPTPPGRPDLLATLDTAGFASLEDVDGLRFDSASFDGRGARILVVGGTDARVDVTRGVVPLARALTAVSAPAVVAHAWRERQGGPARGEELAAIRDDSELAAQIATVDDLDLVDGPLTAVLVLGERGQGTIAHYGFGRGADRAMPEWWMV
jgi:hypothetical protein